MARQSNDPQRGWYDEIMRGQYDDELIPAYEALQAQMADNSNLCTICVRGLASLVATVWALARHAHRLPSLREAARVREVRRRDHNRRPSRYPSTNA